MIASKICTRCKNEESLSNFHRDKASIDGHMGWCKPCQLKANKIWKMENRDRVKKESSDYSKSNREKINARRRERHSQNPSIRRHGHIRRTYGLSVEEYESLLKSQDGKCAICRRESKLHVDHNHANGKVRALLCFACNTGLGMFDDDPKLLAMANAYLLSHS